MMKKLLVILSLLLTAPVWAQSVSPPNQTRVNQTQPTITAVFNDRVRNARIWVDGTEFTTYVRSNDNVVTLVPPYPLDFGDHQVQVRTDNQQLAWNFAIVHGNVGYNQAGVNQNGYVYQPGYNNQPVVNQNGYIYQPGYGNPPVTNNGKQWPVNGSNNQSYQGSNNRGGHHDSRDKDRRKQNNGGQSYGWNNGNR